MAESPAVSSSPRTLHEAKQQIARLRQQLGHGPPQPKPPYGDKPIKPATPPNVPPGGHNLDLSAMAPAAFERFISERNDSELVALLGRENSKPGKLKSDRVVNQLYREAKKRKL